MAHVLLLIATALAFGTDEEPALERARVLREQIFRTQQFAAVAAAGDDKMQEVFQTRGVAMFYQQITTQLGAYEKELAAESSPVGDMTSVNFDLQFARGTMKLRLVINDKKQLSGIWIDGITPKNVYDSPEYVDAGQFTEVELKIGTPPLGATLSLPKQPGPRPAIVLVHGSGSHDRDETVGPNKVFRDIADGLASRGIAVLRYEKRTHAYPNAVKPEDITFEYETIDDAVAAAAALRDRDEIDHEQIYVLGHSLGGLAAPYIAKQDPKLAGIVIMAGPGRRMSDLVIDQLKYLRRVQKRDLTNEERTEFNDMLERLAELGKGRLPEGKILDVPAIYWQRIQSFDAPEAAADLTCRILILHGRRDYQVSMRDYRVWKERFEGQPNVTLKLYPGLNHLMMPGQGPSVPEEYQRVMHVSGNLINDLAAWLQG